MGEAVKAKIEELDKRLDLLMEKLAGMKDAQKGVEELKARVAELEDELRREKGVKEELLKKEKEKFSELEARFKILEGKLSVEKRLRQEALKRVQGLIKELEDAKVE